MKHICTIIIGLLISVFSFAQSITAVYIPRFMQGSGTPNTADDRKVPFACRLTITGLTPNAPYRYYNRFVVDTSAANSSSNGDGFYTIVKQSGRFFRVTSPSLSGVNRFGEFTTDASGSYTGWFAGEASNVPAVFAPGKTIYVRIIINNGVLGNTAVDKRITATNYPITVINFGPSATTNRGTALWSTPATFGTPRNFVMLYDNTAGAGRPIAGTFIESDTADNTVLNGYAPFYANHVNAVEKAWGTIIPNSLADGIKKIVQYSLADGTQVGSKSAANSVWPIAGGGTANTMNPSGADTLVLDGALVPLSPPQPQTITFNTLAAKTYGDITFNPGATASSGLRVTYTSSDLNVATIVNDTMIQIVGTGNTDIKALQTGDDDFSAATPVIQTLTVNKADLTIKADDKFWLQGTPMPELTVAYSGFKNGDDSSDLAPKPTITTTATPVSTPGQYPITANNAGSPNYNFIYQPGTLTVTANKQPQTITFNPLPAKVYGAADFNPAATVSSPLKIRYTSSDTNVATIDTVNNKIHIKKVGTTTITASQPGDLTYEPAQDVSRLLTVNKAALTITAENKTRLYGQPNPALTVVYSGFVNGESKSNLLAQPAITTTAIITSLPGKYPITAKDAASNNYEIEYKDGELTVEPLAPQTINFPAFTVKKYGDADFNPGAKASSGLKVTYRSSNTNVATVVEDTMIHIVGTGSTVITAVQPGDATRAPAPDVTRTLNVQKAALIVSANDQTKNEGQPNPELTITYKGFVNGDDAGDLTTVPVVNTTVTTASLAGTYSISIQGASASNYSIQHRDGLFTVLPALGDGQDNLYAYISSPGQLQLNVYAVNAVKVAVQLFDLNGSRLVNTPVALIKGFNTYHISVGNLTAGIYNVRVAGNGVMLKTKVVVR